MTTSNDIANAAIQQIGDDQQPVTGQAPTFDTSAAGLACAKLYTLCVQTVARQFGWDFSRNIAALTLSGNAPPLGWAFEYKYPTSGIQVRQLLPPAISDPNDPLPVNWSVGNTVVGGVATKVIWANQANAQVTFTGQPPESLWDPLFTEEVVRLLSSELAIALSGKPDTSRLQLESASQFGNIGQVRDS